MLNKVSNLQLFKVLNSVNSIELNGRKYYVAKEVLEAIGLSGNGNVYACIPHRIDKIKLKLEGYKNPITIVSFRGILDIILLRKDTSRLKFYKIQRETIYYLSDILEELYKENSKR